MSSHQDLSVPGPLRFTLDPIGAVWCNARIEISGRAHEALIDYRHHAAIRALLRAALDLRSPPQRGDSTGAAGFAWEGPSCRFRWSFHHEGRGIARLEIDKLPDAFGRETATPAFESLLPIEEFVRQAYRQARSLLRRVGIPEEGESGNGPDLPLEELLQLREALTGERIRIPGGGRNTPRYREWARMTLSAPDEP